MKWIFQNIYLQRVIEKVNFQVDKNWNFLINNLFFSTKFYKQNIVNRNGVPFWHIFEIEDLKETLEEDKYL